MTDYTGAVETARRWIDRRRSSATPLPGRYVCVTSVHGIVTAVRDGSFRRMLNGADMATPDGMPVVWAMRSFGVKEQTRVYGPNLMLALCEQAVKAGHRIYLYGALPETLDELILRLWTRFPGLQIAGYESPPFRALTPEEDAAAVQRILDSRADIVFVGLSTPKQERWMSSHRDKLPGVVMFGVGAAFDFHAGNLRQAPRWMQNSGLEWLFRLLMEPKRLWKRYVSIVPIFLPLWALQKVGILRYDRWSEESSPHAAS